MSEVSEVSEVSGPRVLRAGFAPVKGTRHLSFEQVRLDEYGAVGDRRLCLVDVAARQVLRTVRHPTLMGVVAHEQDGVLTVALPDGRAAVGPIEAGADRLTCEYWGRPADVTLLAGPHAALFSEHLGRPVALAAAPPRAVVYGAGVTLVTRASLDDLGGRVGSAGTAGVTVDPARFRATFVLQTDEPAYAEDAWGGRELALGTAVVRVGAPIGRCAVIDVDPATGQRNGRLLRSLAAYRRRNEAGEPCFGVYAEVIRPGTVRTLSPGPS